MTEKVADLMNSSHIEAPEPVSGKLVTWSRFKGFGKFAGWLAWIGNQRIGRVDVEQDLSAGWYCSLPSEDEEVDGSADDEGSAKVAVEAFAAKWIKQARLIQANDGDRLAPK